MANVLKQRVAYKVQCPYCEDHIFEKVFTIDAGSEETQSKAEAFCPHCEKTVEVEIRGKVSLDKDLLRKAGMEC